MNRQAEAKKLSITTRVFLYRAINNPYIDFWQKHLEKFYDPMECWNRLSESYARDPEYTRKYREDYAYHATHCLMNRMWSGMSLKHLSFSV